MGLIAMSERDLQRIEILSKVIAGRMTLVSAAHVLGLSTRQVRRLLDRIAAAAITLSNARCRSMKWRANSVVTVPPSIARSGAIHSTIANCPTIALSRLLPNSC